MAAKNPHRTAVGRARKLTVEALEFRRILAADLGAIPGHWIAKFDGLPTERAAEQAIASERLDHYAASSSAKVMRSLGGAGLILLETPASIQREQLSSALSRVPGFRSIEPDGLVSGADTIPNDPSYSSLYGLNNSGQTGGLADADIDAPQAWDLTTGNSSIVVGVIDSGIDYHHPDLAANIWTNPGEVAGDQIDNDGNGYVDDVHGYDFINHDSDPADDYGHGTHVAGTIGAVGNNGQGVSGVAWNVKLMALKFLGADGIGPWSAAIEAINYATRMRTTFGVNVRATNNSWGGGGPPQELEAAIAASGNAGMLFVAAAMNNSSDIDATPMYPASCNLPNVIAVAATDHNDNLASFSNYGATSVDIAAPGASVLSTIPGGGYGYKSGTSMATPHITGAAALLWSLDSSSSYSAVRGALLGSTEALPALTGKTATGGRLNVRNALESLQFQITPSSGLQVTENGSAASFTVSLRSAPTADVVIPVNSSDSSEGIVSASSLIFTSANWNQPQSIVITGQNDSENDGDVTFQINLGAAASLDAAFDGFDPLNVFVTNRDNDTKFYVVNDGAIDRTYEYSLTGGMNENYSLDGQNTAPRGAASNAAGTIIWTIDANKTVYVYDAAGTRLGSWTAGGLSGATAMEGIATNGTDIWLLDGKGAKVFKYAGAASRRSGTQTAASSFSLNSANKNAKDFVTDGSSFWVVNDTTADRVFKYSLAGALLGSWTISTSGATAPTGITLDPTSPSHLWIVDNATDRVYRYANAIWLSSGSAAADAVFALDAGNTNPQGIADPPASSTEIPGASTLPVAPSNNFTLGLEPGNHRSYRHSTTDAFFAESETTTGEGWFGAWSSNIEQLGSSTGNRRKK